MRIILKQQTTTTFCYILRLSLSISLRLLTLCLSIMKLFTRIFPLDRKRYAENEVVERGKWIKSECHFRQERRQQ